MMKAISGSLLLDFKKSEEPTGSGCIKTGILMVAWNFLPEAGVAPPRSFLPPCVCLALVPTNPPPCARPASAPSFSRRPCAPVAEIHPLDTQHSEACCPVCLPQSIPYLYGALYLCKVWIVACGSESLVSPLLPNVSFHLSQFAQHGMITGIKAGSCLQ